MERYFYMGLDRLHVIAGTSFQQLGASKRGDRWVLPGHVLVEYDPEARIMRLTHPDSVYKGPFDVRVRFGGSKRPNVLFYVHDRDEPVTLKVLEHEFPERWPHELGVAWLIAVVARIESNFQTTRFREWICSLR